jgi:hypothetical protein
MREWNDCFFVTVGGDEKVIQGVDILIQRAGGMRPDLHVSG